MTSTLCQTLIYKPPSKPGVGGGISAVDCSARTMNTSLPLYLASLLLCAAVYAAALTGYRAFSGVMSMQAVLIPLLSVPLLSAPLSPCLYVCIISAMLFCAVWTAATVCPPPLSSLAAYSIAADTALQNTMVSCNISLMRFLHFKSGMMITKTFAINYLHLYGVFCNAPCLF